MTYNFARTVVDKADYKELEQKSGRWVVRFEEDENADGTLVCAETVCTEEQQMEVVRAAYNNWLEKQQARKLERAKAAKVAEIAAYDSSEAVNSFSLNGASVWLDKATRVGLVNSTTVCKEAGQTTTTLWLDGMKLVIDCDKALQLLAALELYALECFNVTAAHKAEVEAMTALTEVEAFDIRQGYPTKLTMEV